MSPWRPSSSSSTTVAMRFFRPISERPERHGRAPGDRGCMAPQRRQDDGDAHGDLEALAEQPGGGLAAQPGRERLHGDELGVGPALAGRAGAGPGGVLGRRRGEGPDEELDTGDQQEHQDGHVAEQLDRGRAALASSARTPSDHHSTTVPALVVSRSGLLSPGITTGTLRVTLTVLPPADTWASSRQALGRSSTAACWKSWCTASRRAPSLAAWLPSMRV